MDWNISETLKGLEEEGEATGVGFFDDAGGAEFFCAGDGDNAEHLAGVDGVL